MGRVSEFYRKPSTDADRRTDGRGRRTDAAPPGCQGAHARAGRKKEGKKEDDAIENM